MKTILTLLSSILMMVFFAQCGSAQFDKEPPFTIKKAYFQEWVGGKPGSKGTLVTIEISNAADRINFDSIFFKDKIKKLVKTVSDNNQLLSGNFPLSTVSDNNIIMHSDPTKEFGNKAPEKLEKIPFELSDNECVISYLIKEKKHYFKIINLKKENTIYYP